MSTATSDTMPVDTTADAAGNFPRGFVGELESVTLEPSGDVALCLWVGPAAPEEIIDALRRRIDAAARGARSRVRRAIAAAWRSVPDSREEAVHAAKRALREELRAELCDAERELGEIVANRLPALLATRTALGLLSE
jgi:hypothetical protein